MIRRIVRAVLILMGAIILLAYFWPEKSYKPYQVSEAYLAQVRSYHIPDMPSDWIWHDFVTADGTRLRWGETGNRGASKATLIWVPGYSATLDMYGEHVDRLARRGFHVIGLDLRGQGGSERARSKFPEKLWVENFTVYSDDLAVFIRSLELETDKPAILLGISFGGHVATRMAVDHSKITDEIIDGLFLVAPAWMPRSDPYTRDEAIRLMDMSRRFGKAHNYVIGQSDWQPVGLDYSQPSDCSSEPKRIYLRDAIFTLKPEQRVGGVTNQWGAEFFKSSETLTADGYLNRLNIPVRMVSADHDIFVVTKINSQLCRQNVPNCTELRIAGTKHCLPQETDDAVMAQMNDIDALYDSLVAMQAK